MEQGTPTTTTAVPGNGASNASDFQPQTQNPQAVPANQFQQQGNLQGVTNVQEVLSDRQGAQIAVPASPSTGQASRPEAPAGGFPILPFSMLVIAIIAFIVAIQLIRRTTVAHDETAELPVVDEAAIVEAAKQPAQKPKKATNKHRPAKKKKSKRR
jgi:hypothetical protein